MKPFANVVHCDPLSTFLGQKIRNANIWKAVRAGEKCAMVTFTDVDIRHRMEGSIANVICRDLEI